MNKTSKRLGKLSILILEGYLKNKVGDDFVNELGEPYIKREKLIKALENTEYIFKKRYPDGDLSHAMFVDLHQSDRPVLRDAVLRYLDHPTDPDFPEELRCILSEDFRSIEQDRINRAIVAYMKILTEELALEDSQFREKVVALTSLRGGDLWSSLFLDHDQDDKDIVEGKVDVFLEGKIQSFDRKKRNELRRSISSILGVDQNRIRIMSVKPGSIIVRLAMPTYAILLLTKIMLEDSLELRKIGVLSIRIKKEVYKYVKDLRINVVGQGNAGKTSLIERLRHNSFSKDRTITHGIQIEKWGVKIGDERFRMNMWDFGGLPIMHATYQIFLAKNNLYLLVLDTRLNEKENRVTYWLETIKAFAGESPVIIVINKIDTGRFPRFDQPVIRQNYPNVKGFCEISCATGEGFPALRQLIGDAIEEIPYAYLELSLPLFAIKRKIELVQSNYMSYQEYRSLCESEGVSDTLIQKDFINFLHESGTVLYFVENLRLADVVILNPQWITDGIYKILDSKVLFDNKGVLSITMLDEILNSPEFPPDKRLFIVDMMKKFELCYEIEPDQAFLIPEMLPGDEPTDLNFKGIPAFEYVYPVLPMSVFTRFIVRMNQHIYLNSVWRTGVLLRIGRNNALVKADIDDRKITIAIDGLEHTRRDALSAIRYQLDEIHASIKGLEPQKRVPIPDAPNAESLDYDYLLKLESKGEETHLVRDGNRLVRVNIHEVLSAIEGEARRKENVNQSIKDSYNKIISAKIDTELQGSLKQLADAVAVMAKALPDQQAREATEDLAKLVDEATKPKTNKKWYSVSIDGLIKSAENVEKVGEPVIRLSKKVLSLLTVGTG